MTMRSIKACLVAAFAAILLIGSPAAADDICNPGQSMCRVQADKPIRLAADLSVRPLSSARIIPAACRGEQGVKLRRCICEKGCELGSVCHFIAAASPSHESCVRE
jgi:hypothetical protein